MKPLVVDEVGLLGVGLAAFITRERLFSGVTALVFIKVGAVGEELLALYAREHLLAQMLLLMVAKSGFLAELVANVCSLVFDHLHQAGKAWI